MPIEDAIGKAMEQTKAEPTGQTATEAKTPSNEQQPQPTNTDTSTKSPESSQANGAETKDKVEWSGDVTALPEELQKHAKAVQRYVTKREQEAAEYRKKAQDYEAKYKPEMLTELEALRKQVQQTAPPADAPLVTPEEWEEALLDASGGKVNQLLRKAMTTEIAKAKAEYSGTFEQLQQERRLAAAEQQITEFAQVHPEFVELHEAGIMKPVLQATLAAGGSLQQAFDTAKKVGEYYESKALQKAQGRVLEKKNGVAIDKGSTAKPDEVWVDSRDEAMTKTVEAAMAGKKITVKIRPKK